MRALNSFLNLLERASEALGTLFLIAIAGLMFAGVLYRYFLESGIPYSNIIMTYLFAWFVFLMLGPVSRQFGHVGIELVSELALKKRA